LQEEQSTESETKDEDKTDAGEATPEESSDDAATEEEPAEGQAEEEDEEEEEEEEEDEEEIVDPKETLEEGSSPPALSPPTSFWNICRTYIVRLTVSPFQSARTLPSAPPQSTTLTSASSASTSRRARAEPRRTALRSVRSHYHSH
jgi:hypothetical protein